MIPNIDLVVAERYGEALGWCQQNSVDIALADAITNAAIRLRGFPHPVVKVVGDPYESSIQDLSDLVEIAGGTLL